VKLITEQGYQLSEAARNLGINDSILRRWKNAATLPAKDTKSVVTEDLQAELARLKKENHRLRLEREILKKAAAFFAKESGSGID
jgi:transposase